MFVLVTVLYFTTAFARWCEMPQSGKQYLFHPVCAQYEICKNIGASLAIPTDLSLRQYLTHNVYDSDSTISCDIWTDGKLDFDERTISFTNGEQEGFDDIEWDDDEPDDTQTCFGFGRDSLKWRSVECNENNAVICERCKYVYYSNWNNDNTYSSARQKCTDSGAQLATITTKEEMECALSVINDAGGSSAWIGLNSLSDNISPHGADFKHLDGTECGIPFSNRDKWGQCVPSNLWCYNGRPRCPKNSEAGSKCVRLRTDTACNKLDNDIKCDDGEAMDGILCNLPGFPEQCMNTA